MGLGGTVSGWYHIKKPMNVHQLRKIGVRTFWRCDGSISVLVRGVKRVAVQLSAGRRHVGTTVDRHGGPEIYLLSGSVGQGQAHVTDVQIV